MRVTGNKRLLEFNLKNGWRYQEKGNRGDSETEYIRIGFKEYKKQFDLSSFQFNRTDDSVNRNGEKMYSMRQLEHSIDSLKKENERLRKLMLTNTYAQFNFLFFADSNWRKYDTVTLKAVKNLDELLPDSTKQVVSETAIANISAVRVNMESSYMDLKERERNLRKHRIEWHRKITLSLACLVLFLIGAPLGAIIRKGGLGTPMIFAIIFFMLFYFSSTMGEKFGKENKMPVTTGMWLSTIVLVPIGIFLTYKAMHDSQLFNKEFYARLNRNIKKMFRRNV